MDDGPVVTVEQSSVLRGVGRQDWTMEWRIANNGVGPISVVSARLPHGQFKSGEQPFDPPLEITAGAQTRFRALVHCDEPPGLVTENAFIIFQVVWFKEAWRIFVRIRVVVQQNGEPQTGVELITTQRVGFSESN
jgi:hypothetical protein